MKVPVRFQHHGPVHVRVSVLAGKLAVALVNHAERA
jgi:hypothetical protein